MHQSICLHQSAYTIEMYILEKKSQVKPPVWKLDKARPPTSPATEHRYDKGEQLILIPSGRKALWKDDDCEHVPG